VLTRMHKISPCAAVDISARQVQEQRYPVRPKSEMYWATRALYTAFGRAIAIRKTGSHLEVFIRAADNTCMWLPATKVLSGKLGSDWATTSSFNRTKR